MNAPTRPEVATVTQQATCERCGATFEREAVLIGDKPYAAAKRCPGCTAARDREVEQADRSWDSLRTQRHLETREQQAKAAVAALGIPPLYQAASFETWEVHGEEGDRVRQLRMRSAGLRYLTEWPEVHHRLLILRGGPGTGKGHWVWTVAGTIARAGGLARVVKLADLVRELRAAWHSGSSETEEQVLRRFRMLDFLAIDEVSRHAFYGEQVHQHLYDVLDHRLENLRPTVLTSNETQAELAAILRPALWSRVHGAGGILEFGEGPDFRKRPKPQPEKAQEAP